LNDPFTNREKEPESEVHECLYINLNDINKTNAYLVLYIIISVISSWDSYVVAS